MAVLCIGLVPGNQLQAQTNGSAVGVTTEITPFWVSPDRQVILYAGSRDGVHRVCPWLSGAARQPFCRRFESRLVGACGLGDDIIIVLASGDIHRVNYALVNAGGNFEPAYDHPDTLQLTAALLPEPNCLSGDGKLPDIFAINAANQWLQFNGEAWRLQDVGPCKRSGSTSEETNCGLVGEK